MVLLDISQDQEENSISRKGPTIEEMKQEKEGFTELSTVIVLLVADDRNPKEGICHWFPNPN